MAFWHRSGARLTRSIFKPTLEPLEGRALPAVAGLSVIGGHAVQFGVDNAAEIADTVRLDILLAQSATTSNKPNPQELANAQAAVAKDDAAVSQDAALVRQDLAVVGEGLRQAASDPAIRADLGNARAHAREYLTGQKDRAEGAAEEAAGQVLEDLDHAFGVGGATAQKLIRDGRRLKAKGERETSEGKAGLSQDLGEAYKRFLSLLSKDLSASAQPIFPPPIVTLPPITGAYNPPFGTGPFTLRGRFDGAYNSDGSDDRGDGPLSSSLSGAANTTVTPLASGGFHVTGSVQLAQANTYPEGFDNFSGTYSWDFYVSSLSGTFTFTAKGPNNSSVGSLSCTVSVVNGKFSGDWTLNPNGDTADSGGGKIVLQ